MSRYSQRFDAHRGMGNVAGPSAAEQRGGEQASGNADLIRLLSGLAPMAGTLGGAAIGSVIPGAGTMAGGAIGGALGQGAAMAGNFGADQMTKPYEDADAKRQAKLQALMSAFGGRGR